MINIKGVMKSLLVMALSFISFMSCAFKSPPKEAMSSYSYRVGNGYALWAECYNAILLKDGSCQLVYGKTHSLAEEEYGDTLIVDASVMKHIEKIYLDNKMYKLKDRYEPTFFVTDGTSWSATAVFGTERRTRKVLSTGGYETWPDNKGLSAINNYIKSFFPQEEE